MMPGSQIEMRARALCHDVSVRVWSQWSSAADRRAEPLVEREVQLEHVDAGAAEEPNVGGSVCAAIELTHALERRRRAAARHARRLQLRGGRRDVRIQAGAAGRHHFRRHLAGRARLPRFVDRVEPLLHAFRWSGFDGP